MNERELNAAKIIWDWLPIQDSLEPAAMLFLLGSTSTIVADRAAELYSKEYTPFILASGGFGRVSKGSERPGADLYAEILQEHGVPARDILVENKSSNTAENIAFSKALYQTRLVDVKKGIAVTTPLLSRRQKATLQKQWSEIEWQVATPPLVTFEERLKRDDVPQFFHLITGEVDRIEKYYARGFTVYVEVPLEVLEARDILVKLGYDRYIV